MASPTPMQNITATVDGVTHKGTYYTHGPMVYVQNGTKGKATKIGELPPESIATLLLSELVREDLARKAKGK
jgi:hypothetical protein